ncbi:hypothetical protein HYPSUDRAFT_270062 [Hypholoma sublateritium FD-334 SS-4]|uniref:Uncharacterized protein n=1 Tax=Hypholoma sublateritium (strain FD-334 SS-4) TaxID=945553 RepID=A0A0D2N1I9_HYPSF|nr:hypothetical protein HYPSUDRAFT_270062 [Hypholoma sublateritium FD-334 SS-4]
MLSKHIERASSYFDVSTFWLLTWTVSGYRSALHSPPLTSSYACRGPCTQQAPASDVRLNRPIPAPKTVSIAPTPPWHPRHLHAPCTPGPSPRHSTHHLSACRLSSRLSCKSTRADAVQSHVRPLSAAVCLPQGAGNSPAMYTRARSFCGKNNARPGARHIFTPKKYDCTGPIERRGDVGPASPCRSVYKHICWENMRIRGCFMDVHMYT